jgi:PAS domain S-box-containing protein
MWFVLSVAAMPVSATVGRRFILLTRDITARHRAEAALRASERRLRAIIETEPECVKLLGPNCTLMEMNPAGLRMIEANSIDEVIGQSVLGMILPEHRAAFAGLAERVQRGESGVLEFEIQGLKGTRRWLETRAVPLQDAACPGLSVLGITRDITARKQAEDALKASEARFRCVIDASIVPQALNDQQQNIIYLNRAFSQTFGYDLADIPTLADWWPKAYPDPAYRQWVMESWRERLEEAKRTGSEFHPMELKICCKNGAYVIAEASAASLNDSFSDLHLVTLFNITERKRSEEEMKESAKRLLEINSALIQQKRALDQHALVSITDVHGVITYANEKFCDISGYAAEELVGKTHRVINSGCHPSEFFSSLWRDIGAGRVWHGEICNRRKNGELYWVKSTIVPLMTADGKPTGYIAIRTDVTASRESERARRELEGQLLQAQKMEAIGTLAGGIAHDFNNILGIVSGNAEMLGTEATLSPRQYKYQARILAASHRAADLVRQILNFSRQQDSARDIVQFDGLIAEALEFLRASIPASTSVTGLFSAGDSRVRVDVTQIHQVVMNLVTNAWQALPGQQGVITVGTTIVDVSGGILAKGTALAAGRYVQLEVSDNGSGIPPELVGRIFEPFFTTKDPGKGTGLGLAVVHGVVRRHDGAIDVRNNEGGGATFRVLLPVVMDSVSPPVPCSQPPVGGGKRVLVVDDEFALAELASAILTNLGYQVTTCGSSKTALTMLSGNDPGFDVLVMDLAMPDMTGWQLAAAVHARHAELPIVLTTGFIDPASEGELVRLNITGVLMKPWTMSSLAQAVQVALQKNPEGIR